MPAYFLYVLDTEEGTLRKAFVEITFDKTPQRIYIKRKKALLLTLKQLFYFENIFYSLLFY